MSTCTVQVSGRVCGVSPTSDVVGGCEHEHIAFRTLCAWHVEHRHLAVCGPCKDSENAHTCRVVLLPVYA